MAATTHQLPSPAVSLTVNLSVYSISPSSIILSHVLFSSFLPCHSLTYHLFSSCMAFFFHLDISYLKSAISSCLSSDICLIFITISFPPCHISSITSPSVNTQHHFLLPFFTNPSFTYFLPVLSSSAHPLPSTPLPLYTFPATPYLAFQSDDTLR